MSASSVVRPAAPASSHRPQNGAEQMPPLSVVEGRCWLALHLAWPRPRRQLILDRVWPLALQCLTEGLVDRFFFIRYNEEGPHLRLRLRVAADTTSQAVDSILQRAGHMAEEVEGLIIRPHPFELEIERYGGHQHFPASLEFFALSSLGAIDFHRTYEQRARGRQLPAILARLLWQASGFAADADEFVSLLDYYADFSHRFAAAAERAEAVFEKNPDPLRALFEHGIRSFLDAEPSTARYAFDDARRLSMAVDGLEPARRYSVLASQMHMTANRLGLRNPEETYATRLLSKMVADHEMTPWWPRLEAARQRGLETPGNRNFDNAFHSRLARLLEEDK